MRAIDADALRDRLQNLGYDDWNQGATTTWAEAFKECADMVDEQTTIEPELPWIPCKDRLPTEDGDYFVAVDSRYIPPNCRNTDKFIWHDGKWVIADYFVLDSDGWKKPEYKLIEVDIPVLAWMPLPECYREGES